MVRQKIFLPDKQNSNFNLKRTITVLDTESVLKALRTIIDPISNKDIVTAKLVKSLNISEQEITFILEIDPNFESSYHSIKAASEKVIKKLNKVSMVKIFLSSHTKNDKVNE